MADAHWHAHVAQRVREEERVSESGRGRVSEGALEEVGARS